MNNLAHKIDLVSNLTHLYELSMSFGNSFSIEENCKDFLKILVKKTQFQNAIYFYYGPQHNFYHSYKRLKKIDCSLLVQKCSKNLKENNFKKIKKTKANIQLLESYNLNPDLNYAWLNAGKHGGLLLSKSSEITDTQCLQLSPVVIKFGNFMHTVFNQELLKQKEQVYKDIFANASCALAYVVNGKIELVNRELENMTGFDSDHYLGKSAKIFIDKADLKSADAKFQRLFKHEVDDLVFQHKVINNKKETIIAYTKVSRIYDELEGSSCFIFSLIDITELIEKEGSLQERESMLNSVINHSPDAIMMLDLDGGIEFLNENAHQAVQRDFRLSVKKGEKILSKIDENIGKQLEKQRKNALKGNKVVFEYEGLEEDGINPRYYLISVNVVNDGEKKAIGTMFTGIDITLLKNREIAIKKRESLLNSVIESSPENIIAFDKSFNTILANSGSKESFKRNFNIDVSPGVNVFDQMVKEEGLEYKAYFDQALQGKNIEFEYSTIPDKTGRVTHSIISVGPLLDEDKNIFGALSIAKNVTELVINERKLEEREATLDAVLNGSPDGIYAVDKSLNVVAVNKKAIQEFKDIGNLDIKNGINLYDIAPKNMVDDWKKKYYSRAFNGESFKHPYKGININNQTHYFQNLYSPVRDNNDEIIACIEVSRDITDSILNEQILRASEEKYKSLVENSPTGIASLALDGTILFVSQRASQIMKKKVSFFERKNLMNVIPPHYTDKLNTTLQGFRTNKIDTIDFRVNFPLSAESKIYIDGKFTKINDGKDGKESILVVFNDVTEKIMAQKRLESTQIYFTGMYENMFDPILVYDNNTDTILDCNKAAVQFFGYSKFELLQKSRADLVPEYSSLIPGRNLHDLLDRIPKNLSDQINVAEPSSIITKNKAEKYIMVNIIPTRRKESELFLILHDVTKEIAANKNLQKINEEIEIKNIELQKYIDSNLQLENFAYIASHDLKAPLRTVVSFAHLLKNSYYQGLDDKGKKYLDIVLDSSENMQLLINDLLLFSRVNTERMKAQEINLTDLLRKIKIDLDVELKEKNAEISWDEEVGNIVADRSMIIQLFENLIRNGAKFQKPKSIPKIHIHYDMDKTHHVFCIEDNGIGIKKSDQDKIFLIFEKLHSNDIYEGTGLGLTICKKIVEQHDGKIWLESKPNKGSKFYFTISKMELPTTVE